MNIVCTIIKRATTHLADTMGNITGVIRRRKAAKIMKIDGETFKLKTPATAYEATKDYPGHVLLESEEVKRFGVRAQPLRPTKPLEPKKMYFLVQMPILPPTEETGPRIPFRRVRSGVHVSAKDRLELLMLSKRSVSDIAGGRPGLIVGADQGDHGGQQVRVKVRLPKAQIEKMVQESRDGREVAEKIMGLYAESTEDREIRWKPGFTGARHSGFRARERRVSFAEEEIEEIRSVT